MATCNTNGKLIRYVVGITQGCGNWDDPSVASLASVVPVDAGAPSALILKSITRVAGITLGEEGEVEVPEWDRTAMIADGKRKLQTLAIQARVDEPFSNIVTSASSAANILASYFANRNLVNLNIYLFITGRDWKTLYYYRFVDSQGKKFAQEDQELGSAKLGLVDIDFAPYDAELYDCARNQMVGPTVTSNVFDLGTTFCA